MMGYLDLAQQVEKRLVAANPAHDSKPQHEKRSAWKAFHCVDGRPLPLSEQGASEKTVMQLTNGPYVIRVDHPRNGSIYYIGLDDDLHNQLTSEGKTVRWLHELFQEIQNKLGVSSIYRWSLARVWTTQAGMDVFQGAKIEVRE